MRPGTVSSSPAWKPGNDLKCRTLVCSADKTVKVDAFKEATFTTVNALRYNAALDREELDLLVVGVGKN